MNLVVQRRRAERFLMVPNDVVALLATGELTGNAFAALCVLMSRPDGWGWSVEAIYSGTGLGRDGWQAARRRLVAIGAIVELPRERDASGKVVRENRKFAVDWPPLSREPGKPVHGSEASGSVEIATGKPGSTRPEKPVPYLDETPADAAAAFAAKRRRPPGRVDAERKPDQVSSLGELVEPVPVGAPVGASPAGAVVEAVEGVQERVPSLARTLKPSVTRSPLPEALDYLRERNRSLIARDGSPL